VLLITLNPSNSSTQSHRRLSLLPSSRHLSAASLFSRHLATSPSPRHRRRTRHLATSPSPRHGRRIRRLATSPSPRHGHRIRRPPSRHHCYRGMSSHRHRHRRIPSCCRWIVSCHHRIPSCRRRIASRHHQVSSSPPPPLSLRVLGAAAATAPLSSSSWRRHRHRHRRLTPDFKASRRLILPVRSNA
jgi:hypothetical protein